MPTVSLWHQLICTHKISCICAHPHKYMNICPIHTHIHTYYIQITKKFLCFWQQENFINLEVFCWQDRKFDYKSFLVTPQKNTKKNKSHYFVLNFNLRSSGILFIVYIAYHYDSNLYILTILTQKYTMQIP